MVNKEYAEANGMIYSRKRQARKFLKLNGRQLRIFRIELKRINMTLLDFAIQEGFEG